MVVGQETDTTHANMQDGPEVKASRPLRVTLLACFFGFGTLASGLSVVSLFFPGGPLEPMWRINPRGHAGFIRMGAWAFALLVPVCLACAVAAIGLFRGMRWGHQFAI